MYLLRLARFAIGVGLSTIMITSLLHAGHPYTDQHHFHHPYQDRFPTGSTGFVGTALPTTGPIAELSSPCGAGGHCPVPITAALTLWVCDDATVCINGRATKPQTLGGIHAGSRIYNLAGLENGALTASISVQRHLPDGSIENGQTEITVEAGGKYQVRYPQGFFVEVQVAPELTTRDEVQLMEGEVAPPAVDQNVGHHHAESVAPPSASTPLGSRSVLMPPVPAEELPAKKLFMDNLVPSPVNTPARTDEQK